MIKYPGNLIVSCRNKKKIVKNYANRGMRFENEINQTNDFYIKKNIAIITKRPTPINVVKVNYNNKNALITKAFFKKQSTTDYNGVYNGYYLDFEAKSTKNKNCFPLQNIQINQIEHLERVIKHKGIAFFLIEFSTINEVYFLNAKHIIKYYRNKKKHSISIEEIKKKGSRIIRKIMPIYDYLQCENFKKLLKK